MNEQSGTTTLKNSLAISYTAKHLPYSWSIICLDIYPEEMKIYSHKDIYKNIHSSFIHNSQVVNNPNGEENGNPFQYSCLWNPMDSGDWWAIQSMGITKESDTI